MISRHKHKIKRGLIAFVMSLTLAATVISPVYAGQVVDTEGKVVDHSSNSGSGSLNENAEGVDTGTNAGSHKGGASTAKSGYVVTIVDRSTGQQLAGTQNIGVGANGATIPTGNVVDATLSRLGGKMDTTAALNGVNLPSAFDAQGNSQADQLKAYLNQNNGGPAKDLITQLYGEQVYQGVLSGKYALDLQTVMWFNDSQNGKTVVTTALGGAELLSRNIQGIQSMSLSLETQLRIYIPIIQRFYKKKCPKRAFLRWRFGS